MRIRLRMENLQYEKANSGPEHEHTDPPGRYLDEASVEKLRLRS